MEVTIGVYGMTCGHCQKRVADAVYFLIGWILHRIYIIFKITKFMALKDSFLMIK
jgi:hypothetical protein